MVISMPRGTQDILPEESRKWQYIEEKLRKISSRKNKYFDNMSKNLPQIERIQFLMEYCNL